jgi:hypothetical protein
MDFLVRHVVHGTSINNNSRGIQWLNSQDLDGIRTKTIYFLTTPLPVYHSRFLQALYLSSAVHTQTWRPKLSVYHHHIEGPTSFADVSRNLFFLYIDSINMSHGLLRDFRFECYQTRGRRSYTNGLWTVLFLQPDFSISELLECVLAILKGRRYGTIGVSLPLEETQGGPHYEPISGNVSEQLLFQESLTIINLTASPTPLTSRDSCPYHSPTLRHIDDNRSTRFQGVCGWQQRSSQSATQWSQRLRDRASWALRRCTWLFCSLFNNTFSVT